MWFVILTWGKKQMEVGKPLISIAYSPVVRKGKNIESKTGNRQLPEGEKIINILLIYYS